MTSKKLMPSFVDDIKAPNINLDLRGEKLPIIDGMPCKKAPIISGVTDLTYPDETLGITGEGLCEAWLNIWCEGELRTVKALRSDDSKMQAVIPADMQKSMMIIWPQNEKGIGAPVRVNSPTVWWSNREQLHLDTDYQEIRFFGKSLCMDKNEPIVVIEFPDGVCEKIDVIDFNPYQITAKVPFLPQNHTTCKFYIHNLTGGSYGWSEPYSVCITENKVLKQEQLPIILVDDFGAAPNDGLDDINAIDKAIAAAANYGGAVIKFSEGEYNISRSITIPDCFPKGLYFIGAGMGEYDFASSLKPSEYEHRGLLGSYTSIRFLDTENIPENVIRIHGDNVNILNITIYGTDGHCEGYTMANGPTLTVRGNNINLKNIRFIKVDLRDFTVSEEVQLTCSNHIDISACCHDINILNCEFHFKASAIWINHYIYTEDVQHILFNTSTQVKNVTINGCDFYGYTTPYVHPSGRKPLSDEGEISRGITAMNCDGVIVENCLFKGFDQENAVILDRAMYLPISNRHFYIANNNMHNVGAVPETDYDGNTGEQILFHGSTKYGGIYNVLKSDGLVLTVRTDNIQLKGDDGKYILPCSTTTNAGSHIIEGLLHSNRGMAYICAGKGAGQVRQINCYEIKDKKSIFIINKTWAIEPDETSIIIVTAPFFENIVYKNIIEKDTPTLAQGYKSGGVLFFFDSHSNIVAQNEIKNLAFGVVFNSAFKSPISWNTVRDNKFYGIQEAYKDAAQGGDTTRNATCLCESVVSNAGETAGWDDYNIWYTIGDTFRNNSSSNCDTAAEIVTNRWHRLRNKGIENYFGEEKGNTLTIIENNSFENVADGILVGNPAYWSLIRNNTYSFKQKDGYGGKKVIFEDEITNFKLVNIEDDLVIDDANNTINK